jgi:hypothetical protein
MLSKALPAVDFVMGLLGVGQYTQAVKSTVKVADEMLPVIQELQDILTSERGRQLRQHLATILDHTHEVAPGEIVVAKRGSPYAKGEYVWVGGLVGYEWKDESNVRT